MYRLTLTPTTGRHFTPVGGDTGETEGTEIIEIVPPVEAPAPHEPSPQVAPEPVPA